MPVTANVSPMAAARENLFPLFFRFVLFFLSMLFPPKCKELYLLKRPNGHDGVPLGIPLETACTANGCPPSSISYILHSRCTDVNQKRPRSRAAFFEKGILSEMILFYLQSFLNSSATNCTFVPMITCTAVLLGRITPATPADLIFFSSTAV